MIEIKRSEVIWSEVLKGRIFALLEDALSKSQFSEYTIASVELYQRGEKHE